MQNGRDWIALRDAFKELAAKMAAAENELVTEQDVCSWKKWGNNYDVVPLYQCECDGRMRPFPASGALRDGAKPHWVNPCHDWDDDKFCSGCGRLIEEE